MTIKDDLCFKDSFKFVLIFIDNSRCHDPVTGLTFKVDSHGVRYNYFKLVNTEHRSFENCLK